MDEAAACVKIQGAALPECYSELETRRRETVTALEAAIRAQDFERAALLRDAEVSFRRQLEEAHQDWRDNREAAALSVDPEAIAQVLSRWTGIPVTALAEDEASRLLRLEETLHTFSPAKLVADIPNATTTNNTKPVSYTHLDVYKRQLHPCLNTESLILTRHIL